MDAAARVSGGGAAGQLVFLPVVAYLVEATSWNFKKNFGPLSYLVAAAQIAAQKPPRIIVNDVAWSNTLA